MGLSKPIITTETDISGITTLLSEIKGLTTDAKTAANSAATAAQNSGAVESVQQGIMQAYYSVPKAEKLTLYHDGDSADTYSYYVDITIANVGDITKCAVTCNTFNSGISGSYLYIAKLINSTTLRIYVETYYNNNASYIVNAGAAWQVIKYK